jgi:hypothetical protein
MERQVRILEVVVVEGNKVSHHQRVYDALEVDEFFCSTGSSFIHFTLLLQL